MPQRCPVCLDQLSICFRCGGSEGAPLTGPAASRGYQWATETVQAMVSRWPPWPLNSPDALELATRRVADLHRHADDVQAYLVRICLEAARRRYVELREFLEGKRTAPPR